MKKITVVLLAIVLVFIHFSIIYADTYTYKPFNVALYINGELIEAEREYLIKDGNMLVPAQSVLEKLNVEIDWYPDYNSIILRKDSNTLGMVIGREKSYVNGKIINSPTSPTLLRGTVMIPLRFVIENFGENVGWNDEFKAVFVGTPPVLHRETAASNVSQSKDIKGSIMIDPGHGGWDPGAVYYGVYEKDINLQVAMKLKKMLEESGIKVYMTRTSDKYVNLYDRAEMANKLGVDLYVSIHHNASTNKYASGIMTLFYPSTIIKSSLSGQNLAEIIQDSLLNILKKNDLGEIPRKNLVVLRETKMPAVIAELGFMTNYQELLLLKQDKYQEKETLALYNGIIKAFQLK